MVSRAGRRLYSLVTGVVLLILTQVCAYASFVVIHYPTTESPVTVETGSCFKVLVSWDVRDNPDFDPDRGVVLVIRLPDPLDPQHHSFIQQFRYSDGGFEGSKEYEARVNAPPTAGTYDLIAEIWSYNNDPDSAWWGDKLLVKTTQPRAVIVGTDTSPPTPNPMTWQDEPHVLNATAISMTATTASDPSGVEYYFDETTGNGHDSGWQDSPTYTDSGLSPGVEYCYRVKARDRSTNYNETGWSSTVCVVTPQTDTTPPALVQDFQASDGEGGQSTLTWTDPPDPDVAEILILRKEDGWPESHTDTDGVVVYQAPAKGPGEDEQYVDTGLENGWNDTVQPGRNADTAIPGVIRYIRVISPNGGEEWPVGSQQEIKWESNLDPTERVKIEYSTDGGTTWAIIEESAETLLWRIQAMVTSVYLATTPLVRLQIYDNLDVMVFLSR